MLQRIQTVYLIISALIMGALYYWFPSVLDESGVAIISREEPLVLGLIGVSVLLTIISIFNFKKRTTAICAESLKYHIKLCITGSFRIQVANFIRRDFGLGEGYWGAFSYHFYRFFSVGQ